MAIAWLTLAPSPWPLARRDRHLVASVQRLRERQLGVDYPLTASKGDKQFKRALELNARFTCRVERDATGAVVVRVKNLATREERFASPDAVADFLA